MTPKKLILVTAVLAMSLIGLSCGETEPATSVAIPTVEPTNTTTQGAGAETPTQPAEPPDSAQVTITMTDEGFNPSEITVAIGTTVAFVNRSSTDMWPASAPHPTHTKYPEFDPKQAIAPGDSWNFTFAKSGSWAYHDHLGPSRFGKVIVE